ncbi:unnamed protein product [Pleuronectes platessa]|uniref:C-type lectin domain-containing protein n=1 Tax=Pleuronectes platessa TaxID=8262 RepID=A0A9N7UB99_PLEPL|nr:unnamed protein product [Pleuronectes platessa]
MSNTCFTIHMDKVSFAMAQENCVHNGGNLMTIRDTEEENVLRSLLSQIKGQRQDKGLEFWIGLKLNRGKCVLADKTLRGFMWASGEEDSQYSNWGEEPVSTCTERCVRVSYMLGGFHLETDGWTCAPDGSETSAAPSDDPADEGTHENFTRSLTRTPVELQHQSPPTDSPLPDLGNVTHSGQQSNVSLPPSWVQTVNSRLIVCVLGSVIPLFLLVTDRVDFRTAETACRDRRGELLTFDPETDGRILHTVSQELSGNFWIGLRLPASACSNLSSPLRGYEWISGSTQKSFIPSSDTWKHSTKDTSETAKTPSSAKCTVARANAHV